MNNGRIPILGQQNKNQIDHVPAPFVGSAAFVINGQPIIVGGAPLLLSLATTVAAGVIVSDATLEPSQVASKALAVVVALDQGIAAMTQQKTTEE